MLSFPDYLNDVRRDRHFSYTKINHGFWERLIRIKALTGGTLDVKPAEAEALDAQTGKPCFLATGFLKEFLGLIAGIGSLPGDFRFAATPYAWPACRRILGVPFAGLNEVESIIRQYVPADIPQEDGIFWKTATIDGRIAEFYAALRTRRVALVGPRWLSRFGAFAKLPDFTFIEIDEEAARCERADILRRVSRYAAAAGGKPTIILFQGGPVATWLILKLHGNVANCTLIDMGVALNICSISVVARQDWGRFYRGGIARTIHGINPEWASMNEAYNGVAEKAEQQKLWQEFSSGIDTRIAEAAGVPARADYRPELDFPALEGEVHFLEQKKTDWTRVQQFLELARKANHWTNFGPVTAALERALEHLMGVPASRAVVMCSSGTTALYALIGLHALKRGRPLRVVTSAYGFFCSNTGPLTDAVTLVDCDERALLDIGLLARVPAESYDAVLLTNVFGMSSEFDVYRDFCRANRKTLLVDNATAPVGYKRDYDGAPDEIVSFHHTKPWGVGEGGCAVVAREDADTLRGFLNFGVGLPPAAAPYATNGKISDFSSALILDRLERYPVWTTYYRAQYSRILRLARAAGLREFRADNDKQVHAHLPMLAPAARSMKDLQGGPFPIRKYYRPLADRGMPVAASIYERMVNIPTHAGMAAVPTDVISEVLQRVQKGTGFDR